MRAKGLSAALRKLSAALRLYWILASASVRAAMQYKLDFGAFYHPGGYRGFDYTSWQ